MSAASRGSRDRRAPKQLLIGGEWRDAAGGETLAVEDPATGETLCEVADATPEDAHGGARRRRRRAGGVGRDARRTSAREILHRAFVALNERADELALLMTLEMGKAVAESKAEITYAAEFFRWFSGEALRIDGYYKTAGNGAGPGAGDAPAGRPLLLHHPLELPDRDGHAQDRPGDRGRLHDGDQAGAADAALDAGPGGAARRVRAARRRPQRDHQLVLERGLRSRSSPTRGCASSASPARPRSAAS